MIFSIDDIIRNLGEKFKFIKPSDPLLIAKLLRDNVSKADNGFILFKGELCSIGGGNLTFKVNSDEIVINYQGNFTMINMWRDHELIACPKGDKTFDYKIRDTVSGQYL